MRGLDELLAEAVRGGVSPLIRAEVWQGGQRRYSGGNAPPELLFDLASVTKVLGTTALLLAHHLPLDAPLRRFVPAASTTATLEDLLFHRSGLPPFRPFFADALGRHPALRDVAPQPALRAQVRAEVLDAVHQVPPEAAPGVRTAYSDLGFILLGETLERALGAPLDALFEATMARPLGLDARFHRLSAPPQDARPCAPTGATRPREPAPGQEGLWQVPAGPTHPGQVDDDNAWVLDGVSGHAGLFGTAEAVARFGVAVLEGHLGPPSTWRRDTAPGSTRTLGFDTPSAEGASCGRGFGRAGPLGAIGHLGFTGTSLWLDLDRELVVVLLTNRVALGRGNLAIRELRPHFHEAVLDAAGLEVR